MLAALMIFTAAFASVLLLGFQSKLMRDNNWKCSFFTSWLITMAQTAGTWAIAHQTLSIQWYVFWAGWGGSLGIVSAHFLYDWYDKLKERKRVRT